MTLTLMMMVPLVLLYEFSIFLFAHGDAPPHRGRRQRGVKNG